MIHIDFLCVLFISKLRKASHCQEEDCKPKTQKKAKVEFKEVLEPKLHEDDPLSIVTTIIAQVLHEKS